MLTTVSLEDRFTEMFGDTNRTELARKLGISRQTLYAAFKRERDQGSHGIDSDTAIAIRRLTGRSLSWILTGEEDAPRAPDIQLRTARRVAGEVAKDAGLSLSEARALVGRIVLDDSVQWIDDLELYRLAMQAAHVPSIKAHSSAPKQKLLGVGSKVAASRKR